MVYDVIRGLCWNTRAAVVFLRTPHDIMAYDFIGVFVGPLALLCFLKLHNGSQWRPAGVGDVTAFQPRQPDKETKQESMMTSWFMMSSGSLLEHWCCCVFESFIMGWSR